ncbi:hypothetical protein JCM1840_003865 [Sporobolomyces johnsonii]
MNQAPAVGGASTSRAKPATEQPRHSPWDPYAVLPPSTKRKLDPRDNLPVHPYLQSLAIPADVADERLAGKYLQLDPPEGKMSDWRKAELATKDKEKHKKRAKTPKEGHCGLMGRRKRAAARGRHPVATVNYAAVLPVHHLWLGYMAELLGLPIDIPPSPPSATTAPSTSSPGSAATSTNATSTLLPTYPSRHEPVPAEAQDLQINVVNLQTKLVKAEFVGCILRVKRAKNPSLVGLNGIVLQETQGTFKLVTPKSQIKVVAKQGSVFNLALPLRPLTSSPTTREPTARELQLDIFGDSFAHRSADRVGRKWKAGTSAGGVEL